MPKKFSPQLLAERILRLAKERGSDAVDVRDAAHEASHAIELGLKDWNRETLHEAVSKLPRAEQYRSEMLARATEANISALCELKYDQDYYLMLACIEGAKGGIIFPPDFKAHVEHARGSLEVWSIVSASFVSRKEPRSHADHTHPPRERPHQPPLSHCP